jgi:hypothetical protein
MRARIGLVGLVVLVVLAGCGGSPKGATAGDRPPETESAGEAKVTDLDRSLDDLVAARCAATRSASSRWRRTWWGRGKGSSLPRSLSGP